ncbi:DUF2231 domain-containing protein [Micromonospora sp. NPDC049559]|uniref:DUF2231 domain-containing protein n=1 Tax=Micromonospora sp. NPDC049559 TaxID=3155923 RepID=UPI00341D7FE3
MFREILGLPAHALVVHAAVVFVPLLALFAIGYAVVPRLRGRIGWVAAVLAVLGPVTSFVAKESGEELKQVLIRKGYPPEIVSQVNQHQEYGDALFWFALGLGVATLVLLFLTSGRARARRLPSWLAVVLSAVVVVLGVLTAWYAYRTGDSGAHIVWQGVL